MILRRFRHRSEIVETGLDFRSPLQDSSVAVTSVFRVAREEGGDT